MQSLYDYIKWLGRFSFRELPFCDADALVLCVLSYFDLSPAFEEKNGGTVTVADCTSCLKDGQLTLLITGGDMGNSDVFRAAIASKRFGSLAITNYEDIVRTEMDGPLQFSAVTFHSDAGFSFIAFRGTDETIAGWKEDFMISFTETEAQKLAAEYAERIIEPGQRYYLGGHSKGGNQALYAACRLSGEAWSMVERVYLLDGPGLCPEVMDLSAVERVNEKATRIIPEFDVVGKLFEPKIDDTRIIRSSAAGILQHSLPTWGVEYGELALAEEHDRHSVILMQILNRWIENIDQEGRRVLADDLFDALAAGGAVTLKEVAGGGAQSFESVLVQMFHASDITKKIMMDLPAQALAELRQRLRPAAE